MGGDYKKEYALDKKAVRIEDAGSFSLYRKVLLWRTLDIKIAHTEAGIANKR